MPSPIVHPRVRFFDASGNPLSNGYLYCFAAGTTTPLATYTDSAGAVPNAHPIQLDASGECVVWLGDAGAYDFELKNSAMVTQPAPGLSVQSMARIVTTMDTALRGQLASVSSNSVGAGMIGFDPVLSYGSATIGGWVNKQDVNVLAYIPSAQWAAILAGTSTYDAAAAINNAFAAAAARTPCRVYFPSGKYKINSSLNSITANDLTIDLNGSTLDFSGVQTTTFERLIYVVGAYGATAALTANAAVRATTISAPSSGFAAGDFVRLYSSTIWDSTRTNTRIGEINIIETVPGGTSVTIVEQTKSAYTTAASATLQKLTMCRSVHIKNGTIIGPGANDQLGGIEIRLGVDCSITNVSTRDIDLFHMRLTDCVQSRITGCTLDEANEDSQAYGVTFMDAAQHCICAHNTMRNVRHAFTTNNNTTTSYGITRYCLVNDNTIYNNVTNVGGTSGDALDTHAGCEHITFANNIVSGAYGIGINFEGRAAIIVGNEITGASAHGIRFAPYVDGVAAEAIISGNDLKDIGDGTGQDYGIIVSPVVYEISGIVVSDNKIKSNDSPINLNGTAAFPIKKFTISGNVADSWVTGPTADKFFGIEASYLDGGTIVGNYASGEIRGIEISNSTDVAIVGNTVRITGTSGSIGYGIRAAGTCTYVNMTGNTAYYSDSGLTTTVGVSASGASSYCGVWNNITHGFGTSASTSGGTGSVAANNI